MKHLVIVPYEIPFICDEGAFAAISDCLSGTVPDLMFVVSDSIVWSLHGQRLLQYLTPMTRVEVELIEGCEASKTMSVIERLCEAAIDRGVSRRSVVVAFGGGVVGNVAGLVASLLFRGVRLLHLPTTLMSACDSVVSLKQGVNSRRLKNAFGAYHSPSGILIDPHVFMTLPEREFRSGMGEMAKNALIVTPGHRDELRTIVMEWPALTPAEWQRLVLLGVEAKMAVMRTDPRESAQAIVFEYGHTIGHALELADFHRRGVEGTRHGAAVAIGMVAAARVSEALGIARPGLAARHQAFLEQMHLPVTMPPGLSADEVMTYVLKDNKRGRLPTAPDQVLMVLLEHEGKVAGPHDLPLVPVPAVTVASVVTSLVDSR